MKKLKQQIAKLLKITQEDILKNDYYHPKLFGETQSVEFSCDGLVNVHFKLTKWVNGEGYDLTFDTDKQDTKFIQLHSDEIDCLISGLMHFKYF